MKAFQFAFILTFLFWGAKVFAQAAGVEIPADATTVNDVILAIGALITGVKGASTLAIIALVNQLISKFGLSPLWDALGLDAKYKFLVFALTSMVTSVSTLMLQGQSFLVALTSGGVLLLISQYGYRIYELFIEKKK